PRVRPIVLGHPGPLGLRRYGFHRRFAHHRPAAADQGHPLVTPQWLVATRHDRPDPAGRHPGWLHPLAHPAGRNVTHAHPRHRPALDSAALGATTVVIAPGAAWALLS